MKNFKSFLESKDEYDNEGSMAKGQLKTMIDAAQQLHDMLSDDENMPEWVQSKITKATDYIDTARDYMKSQDGEEVNQQEACWDTHKQVGMKEKGNRLVPNCVPKNESIPPEIVGAVIAAPMVAQGAKHAIKGAAKAVKGLYKGKKAVNRAGEKLAKRVIK
jgi:serine protease inhibitor